MKQHVHGRKTRPTYLLSCRVVSQKRPSRATNAAGAFGKNPYSPRLYPDLRFFPRWRFRHSFEERYSQLISCFDSTVQYMPSSRQSFFWNWSSLYQSTFFSAYLPPIHLGYPPEFPFGILPPRDFLSLRTVAHPYIISPLILAPSPFSLRITK